MGLLLKILSGPHQGAEFDVPDNEDVSIGSSDESDVIISDVLVAARHVSLKKEGKKVTLTPIDGDTFVDGKLLLASQEIEVFQFITIGATQMMIGGDHDNRWEDVSLSDVPELEKVDKDDSESHENEESLSSDDTKRSDKEKPSTAKFSSAEAIEKLPSVKKSFFRRLWEFSVKLFFLFVIALVISITSVLLSERPSGLRVKPQSIEDRINRAIAALKIKTKLKVSRIDDNVSVVGYVNLMSESASLKSAIRAVSEDASLKIFSVEKIVGSVTEIINQSKKNVKILPDDDFGSFTVRGYIYKAAEWENLKEEIASVYGVSNLNDEVLTKTTAVEAAVSILSKYGMNNNIDVRPDEKGLTMVGTISDRDKTIWTETKAELEQFFKKRLNLSFAISISTDRNITVEKFFGGKIDSVNFNNQGLDWINIKDGNKYFQGSVLPSGYVIDRIEKNSITIKNVEETLKLDLEWL